MANDQFSLCWDNFHANMSSGLSSLLKSEDLVDVTLAAEGRYLKAHKMVLSVCSPYFKELFQVNPCKHPIVFLKDVSYSVMSSLLEFMYQGEVKVSQDVLGTFIKTAEALKIKGLTGDNQIETEPETTSTPVLNNKTPTDNAVTYTRKSIREKTPPRKKMLGPASKRFKPDTEFVSCQAQAAEQSVETAQIDQKTPAIDSAPTKSSQSLVPVTTFKLEPEETAISLANDEDLTYDDSAMDDMGMDNTADYMDSNDDPKAGTSTEVSNAEVPGENQESKDVPGVSVVEELEKQPEIEIFTPIEQLSVSSEQTEKASASSEHTKEASASSEYTESTTTLTDSTQQSAECTEKPSVSAECTAKPSVSAECTEQPSVSAECIEQPSVSAENIEQPSVSAECIEQPSVSAEPVQDTLRVVEGPRGGKHLLIGGYTYRLLRRVETKSVWRCTKYDLRRGERCAAECITFTDNTVVFLKHHAHGPADQSLDNVRVVYEKPHDVAEVPKVEDLEKKPKVEVLEPTDQILVSSERTEEASASSECIEVFSASSEFTESTVADCSVSSVDEILAERAEQTAVSAESIEQPSVSAEPIQNSRVETLKVIQGPRGGKRLLIGGYVYEEHNKIQSKCTWRCVNRRSKRILCAARCITCIDGTVVFKGHHKHAMLPILDNTRVLYETQFIVE